jgi:hypothetical protein
MRKVYDTGGFMMRAIVGSVQITGGLKPAAQRLA